MINHKIILAFALLLATAFTLIACGSGSGSSGSPSVATTRSSSDTASNTSGSITDPLVGVWQSDRFTLEDVEAALRSEFKAAAIQAMEPLPHGCLPKEGETHVITLHFAAGQLVVSDAIDGGPSREGYTGTYAVQDAHTFATGDTARLYITVHYGIDGDRLITKLVADAFPDHTPWSDAQDGPGASALNGVVTKALGDRICSAAAYETTPFTRIG
jgi:hypothetical protein